MFSELKVVKVWDDITKFENDVNGWCCNADYKIISCEVTVVANVNIMYTAFLGKSYD